MDSRPTIGGPGALTRRNFVKRSGVLGAAAWFAATGWEKTIGRALAAVTAGLDGRHRRTYVALVEAVSASESAHVSRADAKEIAERYERWFDRQSPHVQQAVGSILDAVETGYEKGRFHRASVAERLEYVRASAYAPRARSSRDTSGDGTDRAKAERMREYAQDPRYRGDPEDFSSLKPVPGATATSSAAYRLESSDEDVARATVMQAALELLSVPATADDPEALEKPAPVTV